MQNGSMTVCKPRFVTFTGVDDQTDLEEMCRLSRAYPIEWAVLFSPKRQATGRYPSLAFIEQLASYRVGGQGPLSLSAHLCGSDARTVLATGESAHDSLLRGRFSRAQLNTVDLHVDIARVADWGRSVGVTPILQCRGPFPTHAGVQSLFDTSGGRGLKPEAWPPAHREGEFVGYAGGLGPHNIGEAAVQIGRVATSFWLDLETGARDEHDRFSLAKCRAVCEILFGAPRESRYLAKAA